MTILQTLLKKTESASIVESASVWFSSLSAKDRTAIKLLVGFFFSLLLFYGAWKPVMLFQQEAVVEHQLQSDLLSWMKENEVKARTLSAQSGREAVIRNESILSIVDSSSKEHNIILQKYEPSRDDGVRVWLENVQFNSLVVWLDKLSLQYDIQVLKLNLDRKSDAGLIDVRLELN